MMFTLAGFLIQFLEKISNWTEDPDDMIMMPLERLDAVEMTMDLLAKTKVGPPPRGSREVTGHILRLARFAGSLVTFKLC